MTSLLGGAQVNRGQWHFGPGKISPYFEVFFSFFPQENMIKNTMAKIEPSLTTGAFRQAQGGYRAFSEPLTLSLYKNNKI